VLESLVTQNLVLWKMKFYMDHMLVIPKLGDIVNNIVENISLYSVLRIRDVYPGSDHFLLSRIRIRLSFILDPDPTNKGRENKLTFFMQE
jgi:hypothetical protein